MKKLEYACPECDRRMPMGVVGATITHTWECEGREHNRLLQVSPKREQPKNEQLHLGGENE